MARKKKEEAEIKDVEIKVEDVKVPARKAVVNFGIYSVDLRIDSGSGYGLIIMPDGSQFEFAGEIRSL